MSDTATDGTPVEAPLAAPDAGLRLCGRFTNGIDAKSRVVLPSAFRPAFEGGGFLTPWKGICLAAMGPAEFDRYRAHTARLLTDRGEPDVDGVLRTLWSSTVEFRLDLQGRLVLPEEVRNQVGITDEVRFIGYGRRVELWPAAVTATELDERADHLATLATVQGTYLPDLEM
jgi:MraZ protein